MNRINLATLAVFSFLITSASSPAQLDYGPAPKPPITAPAPPLSGDKFHWPDSMAGVASAPLKENVKGTLAIQAVQGTPGGRPIAAADIEIQLHHRGMLLDTIKAHLDEHGVALVEDIPVAMGVQPTVRMVWADLTYLVTGTPMDVANLQQKLELICYEPTEQRPDWKVLMRHVMVSPAPEGFAVTEVMVIENPANETWIGEKSGVLPNAKRNTTAFKLPANATDISLGRGFHEWCCSTHDTSKGALVNHLPLMPGTTEMVFSYLVPAKKGKATIDMVAPSSLDHIMVLVSESAKIDAFTGLEDRGVQSMGGPGNGAEGQTAMHAFMATNQAAGQSATITLANLRQEGPAVASTASQSLARTIAMVGGVAIIVIAIAIIVIRRKPAPRIAAHAAKSKALTFDI